MNLVIFGAPGAGKGTQSGYLIDKYGIPQISTGEILRAQRRAGTPLGERARSYMDRGELVPDDVMIDIVRDRLQQPDAARGFILDGFPRTVPQAEALDKMLAELGKQIEKVLYLRASRQALLDRLLHRGERSDRTDDAPEVIARRIDVFLKNTAPLIDYYTTQNKLENIDGQLGMDEVRAEISERLKHLTGPRQSRP